MCLTGSCTFRASQPTPTLNPTPLTHIPSAPRRLQVRCAGSVWLVSLLLHCGRHARLLALLPEAQQALSQLLGDPNELTQVGATQ